MADNVEVTAGTGTSIATDDVGGAHYQKVKIALGADNAVDTLLDSGQQAMSASAPVVLASDHTDVKVTLDGEAIAGTVTANAGTNLNTSALALESGGNLAAAAASLATLDNCISGSEAQVDVVAALPAGTNNIGDVDVLTVPTPIRGPGNPVVDSYSTAAVTTTANTADQQLVAAPGANKQIWVYGLVLVAGTGDGSFSLQDEDNTALSGVMTISQRGGFVLPPSGNFSMPWIKVATNKALEIDTVTCDAEGIITYAVVDVT